MHETVRWLLLAAVLLPLALAPASGGVLAQDAAADDSTGSLWAPLGPSGPWQAERVAVSSGWPEDQFLLVTLSDRQRDGAFQATPPPAARTYDGGKTWEPLSVAPPPGGITAIWTAAHGRVLLALQPFEAYVSAPPPHGLWRSADDGMTWASAIDPADLPAAPRLVISSDVQHDGRLILLGDDRAVQSSDAGATWAPFDPVPGQRIGTLLFSPDFADDRTIYLTAVSGGFSAIGSSRPDPQADQHHHLSAGVMMSTDGGDTWEGRSGGLQIDGDPYRQVTSLAISPTFAQDGTLFAYAWGPWFAATSGGYRGPHTSLFRSEDRGLTWTPVWEPFSRAAARRSGVGGRSWVSPVLSPAFADNGLVLAIAQSRAGSPGSSMCRMLRSEDGGATWAESIAVSSYGRCERLHFVGREAHTAIWHVTSGMGTGTGWATTQPGNVPPNWSAFGPMPWLWGLYDSSRPVVGPERTLFVPGPGGLWAYGPSARTTDGRLPCAIHEAGAFAARRAAAPLARPWLGCPTDVPRTVAIHERRLADTRALWTEDDDPRSIVLAGTPGKDMGVGRPSKADEPWHGPPDRIVTGEVQRFEGGIILRLPRADGSGWSALVASAVGWQEVSEP